MVDPKEVEEKVKWYQQFKFELETNYEEDYIPGDPDYPDVAKYNINAFNEELGVYIMYFIEDEEGYKFYDAVIKRLKKIKGITDPWDDDPDYIRRNLARKEAEFGKKVENNLKDSEGNYYLLKINQSNEDVPNDDFLPEIVYQPDACRYSIYLHDKESNVFKTIYFEDTTLKDAVVKRLKKIHGINDPWDDDPDYFTEIVDKKYEYLDGINKKREKCKLPKVIKLGKHQVGERKSNIYLVAEQEKEIRELWPSWIGFMDRKVVTWTEIANTDENILQDRQIILEKRPEESNKKWKLIYQRWYRKYILDDNGEKKWIGADHNGIEKFEYYYDVDIKVKFKKKI